MNKSIFINMNSEEYDLAIEGRNVSKIMLISPLCANLSCELINYQDRMVMNMYDRIACSFLGDKSVISHLYSPNFLSKTVKMIVPNDLVVNLDVNLEIGSIFLKDIVFDEVNLSSIRGNISMKNCSGGITLIDGYQSDVLLQGVSGSDCFVNTRTGNVKFEDNIFNNALVKTDIGNIGVVGSDIFLNDTEVLFAFKNMEEKKLDIFDTKEKSKKLSLYAPHGKISSNIF